MELWTETCAFLIDTCIFNRGDLHSFGPTKFLVSAKFAARLQSCTKHSILQQTGLLTPGDTAVILRNNLMLDRPTIEVEMFHP